MITSQVLNVVNPEVVIPVPKQVKLLGAEVKGVGTITTVSEQNVWRWSLIEDESGREHHLFLADLHKDQLELSKELVPYRHVTRRIGYGLVRISKRGTGLCSFPVPDGSDGET